MLLGLAASVKSIYKPCLILTRFSSSNQFKRAAANNKTSVFKSLVKPVIVFEVALFLGSYALWKSMNQSQEFRFYMKTNYPSILEGYYLIGEKAGNLKTREQDLECWKKSK